MPDYTKFTEAQLRYDLTVYRQMGNGEERHAKVPLIIAELKRRGLKP